MAADAKKILDRLAALVGKRSPYEQDWRDCFDMTFPVRGNGFQSATSTDTARGKNAARLDSTGTDSARTLASGLMGGITPANSRWFGLDVGDETDEERQWLDDAADTIWQNIHAANFDAAGFECCLDVVAAGWFVLFTDLNREVGGGYAFEQWPLAECFISSTRQDGRADTIYRKYCMTAQQAVEHFTKRGGKVSDKLHRMAMDKPYDNVDLVRVIEPRQLYVPGSKLSKNMPFMSCDIEIDGKHVILEQGFEEFPCAVPRWTMIPGSVYAVGPAFDALPDMLELNELVRMEKAAADLAIAGMWIAEDDGVLNPKTVKVGPRKIIVANSVDSMKPLKSGSDFNYAESKIARLQASIRKILMADQLQAQDGPAMTATEVHVRVALIRQLLGPVYGRLQAEYLQPMITRCFGIAYRAGVLGQAPESLAGRNYSIRYISPLARSQKLEEVTAIDQFIEGAAAAAAIDPTVMDNVDLDEAQRIRGEALGVPSAVIRSKADVSARREQRAQEAQAAQQQEQQAAMQQQVAMAATKQAGAA